MNQKTKEWLETLSKEQQAFVLQEILRSKYRNSLFLTSKLLGYKDINYRTHGAVIESLEASSKRKLIVMPRGTLKSSLASVAYPIWLLLRNPNLRIMIDSEKYDNSKNFLREIKMHLQSEALISVFGTFKTESVWNEGEIIIAQRNKILKEASVVCSGVGVSRVGQHVDVLICDDMNSDKNSQTKEGCQKIVDHYRLNTSILEPTGTLIVIGTRYSENDLIQFILDNEVNLEDAQRGLL